MRARTLAFSLFVISVIILVMIFALFFRVQIQPAASDVDAQAIRQESLIDVKIELPTSEPVAPAFTNAWSATIDIADWKSWGEPLPVIKARKGRNDSWALDPSGDGNYSSGITSRFLVDLRQGAAIEFWVKATTSHQYWQSMDVGFSQAATAAAYEGITQQPVPFVGIHIGAETDQDYIEYFVGNDRQREAYAPLNDQWHHYRMEVDDDGSVRFLRDGELKFAPESKIDLELFDVRPLVIEGRSYQTDVLLDDLTIYGTLIMPDSVLLESASPLFDAGRVLDGSWEMVRHVILPDLDGDGDAEMVVASTGGSNRILVLENDGLAWREQVIAKLPATIFQLTSLDYDSDGDLDILSTSGPDAEYEIVLWENSEANGSAGWRQINLGKSDTEVIAAVTADLDNDGDPDLITGADGAADVELLLWENPGADIEWPSHELGVTGDSVYALALADLDGDGDDDLVSGARRDAVHELMAWVNDGTPFDNRWTRVPIGAAPGDVYDLAVADFDVDGDEELATGGSWHGDPQVLLWSHDGVPLGGAWQRSSVATLQQSVLSLLATDVDDDGRIDLLMGSASLVQTPEITWWHSGDSPDATGWTSSPIGETGQDTRLVTGDLDGDGDADLVSYGNGLLVIWERNAVRSP